MRYGRLGFFALLTTRLVWAVQAKMTALGIARIAASNPDGIAACAIADRSLNAHSYSNQDEPILPHIRERFGICSLQNLPGKPSFENADNCRFSLLPQGYNRCISSKSPHDFIEKFAFVTWPCRQWKNVSSRIIC